MTRLRKQFSGARESAPLDILEQIPIATDSIPGITVPRFRGETSIVGTPSGTISTGGAAADINAGSTSVSGSKVDPDFGAQTVIANQFNKNGGGSGQTTSIDLSTSTDTLNFEGGILTSVT